MGRPVKSKTATVTDEVVKTETVTNDAETVVETVETKTEKVDVKIVSQSTKPVSFEWESGNKIGKVETMSENVAEILERKGLGKKVK